MYLVDIAIDILLDECPFVKEWVDAVNTYIKGSEFPVSKIEAYYDYGYFVPASKNTPENYLINMQKSLALMYEDRLAAELGKVRVTVNLRMGHTTLSHKLPKGFIPKSVRDIVAEITKVRMRMEFDQHGDVAIRDSIPAPNPDIVVEMIMDDVSEEAELDVDDLLDKISKSGVESLTREEKEFLDKKSRDI